MAQNLMTPGVYIEEKNAFPGSVVEVATAIPAFIGYTETASRNGKSLVNQPTRITSFADYLALFGGPFLAKFDVQGPEPIPAAQEGATVEPEAEAATADGSVTEPKGEPFSIGTKEFNIIYPDNNKLLFYNSIRLFYSNGGGTCYIVSVGTYKGKDSIEVDKDELEGGLLKLIKVQEPTIIVMPEAVILKKVSYDIYATILRHCRKMQSRVGIFDIYDGYEERKEGDEDDIITVFREKIGTENLSYGAAYYPWLNTSIVQKGDVTYKNVKEWDKLIPQLSEKDIIEKFKAGFVKKHLSDKLAEIKPEEGTEAVLTDAQKKQFTDEYIEANSKNYHLGLIAVSPSYASLMDELRAKLNLLPASAAMAGIYTMVDNGRGVWKAPANVGLNSVVQPAVNITHDQQEDLNVNAISGKSVNAIRTFQGVGTLVWGARTLDGNSLDWKYINVRRTMIMLEQSIKLALRAYVFEPNDANTWITVKSLIVNFLTEKWKQGALAGSSPEDAFDVQIGLGATMTALDILEGKMLISVKLAIVRPAEFIVVTFEQQMQKS
ncbi:hypothetical protein P872_20230 [Rhodonellum psychrophilum GCM71 = DSM 17998]|uniref:Tail sheath protein C-terminal domain-containing protein n=2 Tax=Rhodonellum TaxID=336827 RepID=U5BX69_9BACT|nr:MULTISPECIES: phage tail sheath C-terminal domain-containing protein [Rhodonellum]ERM81216.1 hypothetical protein P872_20230 [Rhodonellum psychrophilum GCM71 = DSM 17998]SDZ52331.1 hypothetical protein SAMN05444412_12016 [Rhodonellum ikkaensis]